MKKLLICVGLSLATVFVMGCGAGRGLSDQLMTISPSSSWTYSLAGTVLLPSSLGGGTISLASTSKLVTTVRPTKVKDANNIDCNVMERKFTLNLVDGRTVTANMRLLITQDSSGVFIHGLNNTVDDTFDNTKSQLVPSTANPPFKFLYYPNPAVAGSTVTYVNPFGSSFTGQYSFALSSTANRILVTVPAGQFNVRALELHEDFNNLRFTNAAFAPEFGLIGSGIQGTLPDGTQISANAALLTSVK